jgi:transposase
VVECDPSLLPPVNWAAGIDLGLAVFAAVAASDGTSELVSNPRPLGAAERRLAKAQRRLSRMWLAKSVQDAGWARFVRLLEDKAAQHGRRVVRIDRWAPTSQTCSACGRRDGPKPLGVRSWTCPACGAVHHRDVNAARNLLNLMVAAGPAETINACGGDLRPGMVLADAGEAGTRRGAA